MNNFESILCSLSQLEEVLRIARDNEDGRSSLLAGAKDMFDSIRRQFDAMRGSDDEEE